MLKGEVVNDRTNRQCKLSQFRFTFTLGLFLAFLLFRAMPLPLAAQSTDQSSSDRKVITRVEPEYPDALKRLYIGGVVRLEVEVAPSGVVKSTKLLGGSPILGQSSMKAVKQWRYAPAAAEEVLTVKLEFDPHR
ncbi:MAG: energy transducer TonB [Candidatus Sulfotelmatobacter sp.]